MMVAGGRRSIIAHGGRVWLWVVVLAYMVGRAKAGQFHPNKSTTFTNEEQLFKVTGTYLS